MATVLGGSRNTEVIDKTTTDPKESDREDSNPSTVLAVGDRRYVDIVPTAESVMSGWTSNWKNTSKSNRQELFRQFGVDETANFDDLVSVVSSKSYRLWVKGKGDDTWSPSVAYQALARDRDIADRIPAESQFESGQHPQQVEQRRSDLLDQLRQVQDGDLSNDLDPYSGQSLFSEAELKSGQPDAWRYESEETNQYKTGTQAWKNFKNAREETFYDRRETVLQTPVAKAGISKRSTSGGPQLTEGQTMLSRGRGADLDEQRKTVLGGGF